jgi:N-acetyl-anhydromuramyl-L-alanine amidase AmpD
MKATSISGHEASFQTNATDSAGKKFVLTDETVTIPGTTETLTVVDTVRENGDTSFYYQDVYPKKKVILHFTMGYLKGDVAMLTRTQVSVPFLIARNGTIYNLFASKYWSYHLGPGAVGGNTAMSRECIGIEISNIGPLKKIGSNLVTTYSITDVYCSVADTQFYYKLAAPYRGYEYYAKFTESQYVSLVKLLRFLCGRYTVPKAFLNEPKRYKTLPATEFVGYRGIVSHVNCRSDKVDIGPAFEWQRVIMAV